MYNNPAFQMFLMATVDRYWQKAPRERQGWPAGADKMLIVSVGTGTSPGADASLEAKDMNLLFNAAAIPSALMFAALNEQDLLCRVFGDCRAGGPLDREIGTLCPTTGPLAADRKLFTYLRYNAELTEAGLKDLGCAGIEPEVVQKLDSVAAIDDLRTVGRAVAKQSVNVAHFAGFPA
jgi:hypothetical protein